MNWYKKLIKYAEVRYLYHGTSLNNLSSILSEGLVNYKKKIYDNNFENENKLRSLESYTGTYLTENLQIAISSGKTASYKYDIKDNEIVIAVVKIEDTSPNILIDEDLVINPSVIVNKVVKSQGLYGYAEWIKNNFPNIDIAIKKYVEEIIKKRHPGFDERVYNNLYPYIEDFIKKFVIKELSIEVENINNILYDPKSFFESYPFTKNLKVSQSVEDFRQSFDRFITKSHRFTSNMNNIHTYNVRNVNNISYKGKNRIEVVSTLIIDRYSTEYTKINIKYNNNDNALQKYIQDVKKLYGNKIILGENVNELV